MCSSEICSKRFQIGLIALRGPVAHYGVVAAATALVEFDRELPAHSPHTHWLVFEAAEKVFREVGHLDQIDVGVRESSFMQPIQDRMNSDSRADGRLGDARVWLKAERY
jgi:hypothetical protein